MGSKRDPAEREALAELGLKRCGVRAGCGRVLPVEEFNRQKDTWDGRKTRCRECTSGADKDYVAATPELTPHRTAKAAAWAKANPDKANAKVLRWQRANPDRAHGIAKRYRDSVTVRCAIAEPAASPPAHRALSTSGNYAR